MRLPRLHPAAFMIVRHAPGDDSAARVMVEGRSLVVNAPWILHRHGRFWTSPGRFDPSRFLSGALQWPRFGYMPFGVGPRACVGTPFAQTS